MLIIEGLAQCAGFLAFKILEVQEVDIFKNAKEKLLYFLAINKAKFRSPVYPGDTLIYEIEFTKLTSRMAKFKGIAKKANEMVAEAEMMALLEIKLDNV
ncbi:MAG: hypothetical protein IPL53_21340 [Ignavibacteria bacterium]|nr:hypothetical protein [Ignavibacteria bacterium]